MRFLLLGVLAVGLTACGDPTPPIVDMTGVDQGQYSRDLAYCTVRDRDTVVLGNRITRCMREKGYKILVGH